MRTSAPMVASSAGACATRSIPVLLIALVFALPVMAADKLSTAITASKSNVQREAKSQQEVDRLDDETRAMLDEYQQLSRELDVSVAYHDQIERVIASQEQEKSGIQTQMRELESTQREVIPLMLRMIDSLAAMIAADLPFLPQERTRRVDQLHALMDRADVSVGEKYRRVLDAYQIEMAYGRTIEAYTGDVGDAGAERAVDFLRIGRIGLYYQTLDLAEIGHWNAHEGQWETLPAEHRAAIRLGLRIARNRAAPDLLRLPLMAPNQVALTQETPP